MSEINIYTVRLFYVQSLPSPDRDVYISNTYLPLYYTGKQLIKLGSDSRQGGGNVDANALLGKGSPLHM